MATLDKITPCLWFDTQAEEAAKFYIAVFGDGEVQAISRYTKIGFEHHGRPEGSVLAVRFRLGKHQFTAINGGPAFQFSEAISLQVACEDQAEVDRFWNALIKDGGEESMCGWLKDKYGLSWQITPRVLLENMESSDRPAVERMTLAMFQMRKLDIAKLEAAFRGK